MIGRMNKGYALGFLIVVLVLVLGLYVAFTGFISSRDTLRAQPTSPPATQAVQIGSGRSPSPTPTATFFVIPTVAPAEALTPTIEVSSENTTSPPPTEPPAPQPTEPPAIQPTQPPAPPTPLPTPAPAYQYRLGGPPGPDTSYPSCCYIFGVVRGAAGNGLEGVLVQAFNEWNTLPPAATKGGGEAGQYNIPIGSDAVTWYVVVVDAGGNRISSQVPVAFDPSVAGGYRVDWQRTY